jgi:hypothetical protein
MNSPFIPRVTATIDLAAVRHNLARVREYAPQSRVMAAIKADAYGHGAVPIGRALQQAGVDAFAVACLEEALVLREADLSTPITLLEGVLSLEEAEQAARLHLQVVVHDFWQLQLLQRLPPERPLTCGSSSTAACIASASRWRRRRSCWRHYVRVRPGPWPAGSPIWPVPTRLAMQ